MRKRWAAVAVALLGIFGIPAVVFGWGVNGHMMIGEAAALSLPDGMPAFFRAATKQLAYLNPEPDRWRRDAQEAEFGQWLRASGFEHYVFLDLVPPDVLDAPNRYVYLDNLKDRGIASPVAALPVPGLLHLRILELTQQLRIDFRRWRTTTDSQERQWIEARIIDDAGILGHYVADGSNPHHTTIHMLGWVGGGSECYAREPAFHERFETEYVDSNIQLHDLTSGALPEPRVVRDLHTAVLQHLRDANALVTTLYELDCRERFGRDTRGQEQKEFTVGRLKAGAAMLRDLWWTAWITSAANGG